jgi:undecaprenyl-diphosphatase
VIGYGGLVWVALAPGLAYWARRQVLLTTALVAGCVWASDLTASLLKLAFDRPRPFLVVPEADPLIHGTIGDSMPSGHSATSAAGAVALALLLGRALPWLATVGLGVLAAAIAFSRVYVGVHYPLDVLAGAAVGAAVSTAIVLSVRPLLRTSADRPRSGAARTRG